MSTTETARSKIAIPDAARFGGYRLDPDRLVIVGRDKTDVYSDNHWLCRAQKHRAVRDVNLRRVINMIVDGFTSVIEITPGGGVGGGSKYDWLVVKGRGRTIDARMVKRIMAEYTRLATLGEIQAKAEADVEFDLVAEYDRLLSKVAGFPEGESLGRPAVEKLMALGPGFETKFSVLATTTRADPGTLIGRANSDNAAGLRDDVDTPWTQAQSMRDYLVEGEAHGRTEAHVAAYFGCSADTVRNRLKLLEIQPEIRDQALTGAITWTDALSLAGLPPEKAAERLAAIPKKEPGQKRRGKRGKQRRPGSVTAQKIVEFLGPGHDVSKFWKFMSGAEGGLEALLRIDKGLKPIVAPDPKPKAEKTKKVKGAKK